MATSRTTLTGIGIWNSGLRWGDPEEAVDAAAELETLGYSALWIPDVGGDVFGAVKRLLDATTAVTVATGVLNLWKQSAEDTAAGHAIRLERVVDIPAGRIEPGAAYETFSHFAQNADSSIEREIVLSR